MWPATLADSYGGKNHIHYHQEFFAIFIVFDFLTCTYIILVYLEVCTVFVVLHFRLYVTKLLCLKVKMARGLLKYNAARAIEMAT